MKLTVGRFVAWSGQVWRIDLVNECRARLRPAARTTVRIGQRTFKAKGRPVSIAPDSEISQFRTKREAGKGLK